MRIHNGEGLRKAPCARPQRIQRDNHGNGGGQGAQAHVQTFSYAYIRLGDRDIVEGYVTQWRDYDESDVVQVMIDGKYYLTHCSCVVLVADPKYGSLGYSATNLG